MKKRGIAFDLKDTDMVFRSVYIAIKQDKALLIFM